VFLLCLAGMTSALDADVRSALAACALRPSTDQAAFRLDAEARDLRQATDLVVQLLAFKPAAAGRKFKSMYFTYQL